MLQNCIQRVAESHPGEATRSGEASGRIMDDLQIARNCKSGRCGASSCRPAPPPGKVSAAKCPGRDTSTAWAHTLLARHPEGAVRVLVYQDRPQPAVRVLKLDFYRRSRPVYDLHQHLCWLYSSSLLFFFLVCLCIWLFRYPVSIALYSSVFRLRIKVELGCATHARV